MQTQSYKNHSRYVPIYHFGLLLLLVIILAGSVWNFYRAYDAHSGRLSAALIFGLAIAGNIYYIYTRQFALIVQDRTIRAEENFRHFILAGKPLDSRLRMSQIIALRFADDSEFVFLAKRATDENLKGDDIKKAIQNWRADHHRV